VVLKKKTKQKKTKKRIETRLIALIVMAFQSITKINLLFILNHIVRDAQLRIVEAIKITYHHTVLVVNFLIMVVRVVTEHIMKAIKTLNALYATTKELLLKEISTA
jgi:hypothetical protein